MNTNNSKNLLVKAAGFLGVASLSVLISLPGLSQQSTPNTSPSVPSTLKPTNPGSRDAGTTNDGDNLNRVPSAVPNSTDGQPSGTPNSADPSAKPATINRVEGRDQGTSGTMERTQSGGSTMQQNNTTGQPSGTPDNSDPASNPAPVNRVEGSGAEPNQNNGSTMQQNSGSTMQQNRTIQQNRTTPQRSNQSSPQSQSDTNSGSTTDGTSTSQQQPTNGGVRALW